MWLHHKHCYIPALSRASKSQSGCGWFSSFVDSVLNDFLSSSVKLLRSLTTNLEQLCLGIFEKDNDIENRIQLKKDLPPALPEDAQRDVKIFLSKTGIVSRMVREQVNHEDMARLLPSQWLNDALINFYGQLIMSCASEFDQAGSSVVRKPLKVHFFSTFFWSKLTEGYEKGRLAKWTKKVCAHCFQDIECSYLFLVSVRYLHEGYPTYPNQS